MRDREGVGGVQPEASGHRGDGFDVPVAVAVDPDSSATIAAKLEVYHAANGSTVERVANSAASKSPQNDENPGFPGHS